MCATEHSLLSLHHVWCGVASFVVLRAVSGASIVLSKRLQLSRSDLWTRRPSLALLLELQKGIENEGRRLRCHRFEQGCLRDGAVEGIAGEEGEEGTAARKGRRQK